MRHADHYEERTVECRGLEVTAEILTYAGQFYEAPTSEVRLTRIVVADPLLVLEEYGVDYPAGREWCDVSAPAWMDLDELDEAVLDV